MSYYSGTVTLKYVSSESLAGRSIEAILKAVNDGPAVAGPGSCDELEISLGEALKLARQYGCAESFVFFMEDDE